MKKCLHIDRNTLVPSYLVMFALTTLSWNEILPRRESWGQMHRDSVVLMKTPSTVIPSNTQEMVSFSSKQGPATNTAVPPSTFPDRGASVSVAAGK